MKILITSMTSEKGKIVVRSQILPKETENILHEVIEVAEIEEKEGCFKELVYDNKTKKYKFEYREIPKTSDQEQEERIKVLEKALAEALKDKKEDIISEELGDL